jgi:Zn finger protein HypA/HybF involved in hydrogenase expression
VCSKQKGDENRDLVICNNCMWFVSLLKGSEVFDRCPACNGKDLEVMPVEDYEHYKLEVSQKTGLSIEFNGKD